MPKVKSKVEVTASELTALAAVLSELRSLVVLAKKARTGKPVQAKKPRKVRRSPVVFRTGSRNPIP
jgi:hypothetical protein